MHCVNPDALLETGSMCEGCDLQLSCIAAVVHRPATYNGIQSVYSMHRSWMALAFVGPDAMSVHSKVA